MELETHLIVAGQLEFAQGEDPGMVQGKLEVIAKMLNRLISALKDHEGD